MKLLIDSTGAKMPTSCHDCFACFGGLCYVIPAEEDDCCPNEGKPDWCPVRVQEEVEPNIEGDARSTWWYVCGECHTAIDKRDNYCRECGRRIKWDSD